MWLSPQSLLAKEVPGEANIELVDGLVRVSIAVPARTAPLHFVLDTGAGSTILDRKVARELGLRLGDRILVEGTHGQAVAWRVKGFQGRLANNALPETVLAIDLSSVTAACSRRVDGLVGADFFEGRKIQIDFPSRTLRVGSSCREPRASASEIHLERSHDVWCVPVRLNGSPIQWLRLDTGFDGAVSWVPRPNSDVKRTARPTAAFTSSTRGRARANLQIGDLDLNDVAVVLLPRAVFAGESGLLGTEVLSNYCLTLEPTRDRILLEPLP